MTHATFQRILNPALCAVIALCCLSARAEKADSTKLTSVEGEHLIIGEKKGVNSLVGDVELVRGTLLIKADRAVVTKSDSGDQSVVLHAPANGHVSFRQKRDGGKDLWIEGEADRVEYDDKTEIVRFVSNAKVRYLENGKTTQEQEGEFMSYDSKNDVFIATNNASGNRVAGGGRVKLTIQPKADVKSEKKEN